MKKSLLAGILIGIGGLAYLSTGYAILFSVGLLAVIAMGADLYTGKVCKLENYKPALAITYIGNVIGIAAVALMSTRADATELVAKKLTKAPIEILIDGIICGICIAIAVAGYANEIRTILAVVVFIMTGSEHCIADWYYFIVARECTVKALVFIGIVTVGNTIGGLIVAYLEKQKYQEISISF